MKSLPVTYDVSAEQLLGTGSLELLRSRITRHVKNDQSLDWSQRSKILRELDTLIENERNRRAQLAFRQQQLEELEQGLIMAEKKEETYQKYADILNKLRLLKAQTQQTIVNHKRERLMWKVDIIERLLQIKGKYKPVEKQDEHLNELLKIRRQQKLFAAKEQVILDSITRKAMNRAAFIKMVNKKFPDMADELLEFYDRQLFQQGTRR
ncbi:MAG: hypothetical protein AB1746_00050 [Candidatus Zixiibacteriota bacterium]